LKRQEADREKIPLGNAIRHWLNGIHTILRDMGEGGGWIYLFRDSLWRRTVVLCKLYGPDLILLELNPGKYGWLEVGLVRKSW